VLLLWRLSTIFDIWWCPEKVEPLVHLVESLFGGSTRKHVLSLRKVELLVDLVESLFGGSTRKHVLSLRKVELLVDLVGSLFGGSMRKHVLSMRSLLVFPDPLQLDQSEVLRQFTCVSLELTPKHSHLTVARHQLHPHLGPSHQLLLALDDLHLTVELRHSMFILQKSLLQVKVVDFEIFEIVSGGFGALLKTGQLVVYPGCCPVDVLEASTHVGEEFERFCSDTSELNGHAYSAGDLKSGHGGRFLSRGVDGGKVFEMDAVVEDVNTRELQQADRVRGGEEKEARAKGGGGDGDAPVLGQ
jgi:hypothetical protein